MASFFSTNSLPDLIAGVSLSTFQGIEDVDEMLVDLYDYREQLPTYLGLIEADNRINATRTYETIDEDGKKVLSRSTAPATGANVAYVHTKQLQMKERQARYLQEHGSLPDPDEELLNADLSSMPFD